MGEKRFGWKALLAAAVAGAVLLGTGVALGGSQSFTDVPPSHPFFDEIEAVGSAGISTGFSDGSFRPGDNVTRGAMAAFMGRGFGRVSSATNSSIDNVYDDDTVATLAQTSITAGATGAGTGGYVLVVASASILIDASTSGSCACQLAVQIAETGTGAQSSQLMANIAADGSGPELFGIGIQSASVNHVFPIEAGETETYRLRVTQNNTGNVDDLNIDGTISAVYVPFNGTGNAPT